ncbi:MAG TPA: hydroxyisourate hydrolase [Kofleriaceae bacterium]|nr:hydroxyisourate hydrolase [Kofleriaceae bacterium]
MSAITTHVLDTARGMPAAAVAVTLEARNPAGAFLVIARGETDSDGRIKDLGPGEADIAAGVYRITFATGAYFARRSERAFYPEVAVIFEIEAGQHYHVPLLLSPYSYSTYRGS